MATLVIVGLGLYLGMIPGGGSFAITVIPAIFGASVIALFLVVSLVPGDFDRLVKRWTQRQWQVRPDRGAPGNGPGAAATGDPDRDRPGPLARSRICSARSPGGGSTSPSCGRASTRSAASPPKAVIVMAYFVGMLGNTLPLPGGIGGVDGGMIGAFTAFGVGVQVAVVSVLAYRAFSFWLPTLPGAVAYFQLRRTVRRWQEEPARTARPADCSAAHRAGVVMEFRPSNVAILSEVTEHASRT